jgi:hypothetical protein
MKWIDILVVGFIILSLLQLVAGIQLAIDNPIKVVLGVLLVAMSLAFSTI